jgi:hypothetical protein
VYTIDFSDSARSQRLKTLQNIAAAIEEGTKVRFPTENVNPRCRQPAFFSADRLGVLNPNDIEILYKD